MGRSAVEKRKASGFADHFSLALTTWGVGYFPGAPGTYGSAVGVAIYLAAERVDTAVTGAAVHRAWDVWFNSAGLVLFCLAGVWGASRSIELLGNTDPPEAVIDEVLGQLITFCFVPFGLSWPLVIAGFLLFRLFDIVKPYPIDDLQSLPAGLGIVADDLVAGVFAGVCLAFLQAVAMSL